MGSNMTTIEQTKKALELNYIFAKEGIKVGAFIGAHEYNHSFIYLRGEFRTDFNIDDEHTLNEIVGKARELCKHTRGDCREGVNNARF